MEAAYAGKINVSNVDDVVGLGPPESFCSCRGFLRQRQGAGAKVTLSTKMLFGYDDTPEGLLEDKT